MVTATAMIRKSVFDTVGGYDESVKGGMEDWEFWLKCADNGVSLLFSCPPYPCSPPISPNIRHPPFLYLDLTILIYGGPQYQSI